MLAMLKCGLQAFAMRCLLVGQLLEVVESIGQQALVLDILLGQIKSHVTVARSA
ncbi:hypothetical protein D3C76_1841440 [compost metagenome]